MEPKKISVREHRRVERGRLGRNAPQLNKLFGWCGDNSKTLVSTSELLDVGNCAGRMLANVITGLAEGELEAIRERQLDSRRKLREVGRWSGGKVPFGYRSVPVPGGGWALEIDRMSYSVVRRIVDDVLDGKPITRVARELNQEKYLTPGDYYRAVGLGNPMMIDDSADDEPPAYVLTTKSKIRSKWSPTTLRQMLRSKALLGHSHYEGQTVRDDNGMPVLIGEPLVTLDEWELLQATLDDWLSTRNDRKLATSPMLGVLICGVCEKKLHHRGRR